MILWGVHPTSSAGVLSELCTQVRVCATDKESIALRALMFGLERERAVGDNHGSLYERCELLGSDRRSLLVVLTTGHKYRKRASDHQQDGDDKQRICAQTGLWKLISNDAKVGGEILATVW